MSSHGSWPNPISVPAVDEAPVRPFPLKMGVICAVLIALECAVIGAILLLFVNRYVPEARAEMALSDADANTLHTAIMVCGAVGIAVAALLVIGAIRMLAARRAWRAGVIALLVLNAIFPNIVAVLAQTPILGLPVVVDIVGIVCLVLPDTATWFKQNGARPAR